MAVSHTWTMSTALLTPDAEHLFNLCAFFSPEPIAGELLLENARTVSQPARAARVPVLLAPVPRGGEPDAPAVPGQGGRGP